MSSPIKLIVESIVRRCRDEDLDVNPTLAAFVARMIVFEHPDEFSLDESLSEVAVGKLVNLAVEYMHRKDDPSLETVRMQVSFDSAYFAQSQKLEKETAQRERRLADIESSICKVTPKSGSDVDALTALYRQVFSYLTMHGDAVGSAHPDVQREMAAALESVFPRVGLKSFIALNDTDKASQLRELAHLILGIRLFNWTAGRGGATLSDLPTEVTGESNMLTDALDEDRNAVEEVCTQYAAVLAKEGPTSGDEAERRMRWKRELVNRRQLLEFLTDLSNEVAEISESLQRVIASYNTTMGDLQKLVGGRASVPKEVVYPKFHDVAANWLNMMDIRKQLRARRVAMDTLSPHVPPRICTMGLESVRAGRSKPREARGEDVASGKGDDLEVGVTGLRRAEEIGEGKGESKGEGKGDDGAGDADGVGGGGEGGAAPRTLETIPDDDEGPVRLSLESSPDLMALPLEYNGYCPVTIVDRGGLLLPGDAAVGVVRYARRFYVFTNEKGLLKFMEKPESYRTGVVDCARRSAELVNLLHLHDEFAEVYSGPYGAPTRGRVVDKEGLSTSAPPTMKDFGTQTPVHFVEKHIDPRYEWNEWALRRKALQVANLKHAKTVSSQTDVSKFKRDNDAQTYAPRVKGTQTGITRGTNPIRRHRYITGLRGGGTVERPPEGGYVKDASGEKVKWKPYNKTTAAVVSLKLEL